MTGPVAAMVVQAGEVKVGDWLVLIHLGVREVVEVDEWIEATGLEPGPRVSIVYRTGGRSSSYENKSDRHGASSQEQVLATYRPLRPVELVAIERELPGGELDG